MKKLIPVLLVCAVLCLYFLAKETVAKPPAIQKLIGIVNSVSINPDPMRGNSSLISITPDEGQKMDFEVNTGIGVTMGESDKSISLRQIEVGDKVAVEYIVTKGGVNRVTLMERYGRYK